mgnify:CR=1 FL=1
MTSDNTRIADPSPQAFAGDSPGQTAKRLFGAMRPKFFPASVLPVFLRETLSETYRARQVRIVSNAQALAEQMMRRGFPVLTGGTDNHMLLLDLTALDITGKDAEAILAAGDAGVLRLMNRELARMKRNPRHRS